MTVFKPEELFIRLSEGVLVVTGNSRLARVLSGQYSQWRMARGESQWRSPRILPWNAWLDDVWEQAGLQGLHDSGFSVPNRQQLLSLWEQALDRSGKTGALLRPQSLAAQAMETRRTAVEWRLDFGHPAWRGSDDDNHHAFWRWNSEFEALCRKTGWLPPEDRPARVTALLDEGTFRYEARIDLLGFDEFNPAQAELLRALERAGSALAPVSLSSRGMVPKMWKAMGRRQELDRMARWVRRRYTESEETVIAVIVPDLETRRHEVERALQDILLPGRPLAPAGERPWNVSMGTPLHRLPMIGSAFDLFEMLNRRVAIQTVGAVLRSPWITGAAEEGGPRALLEKRLRDIYPRLLDLDEVEFQARQKRQHARDGSALPPEQHEPRPWNCPMLRPVLQALAAFDKRGHKTASAWADAFEKLLNRCGWPVAGNTVAAADEHDANWQAYQAWQEALRTLASTDAAAPKMELAHAVAMLRQICREKVFQPATGPARIQVLGLYEANSLRFDHLWVLGLHNDNWPPPARPDPFIPRQLQQESGLPHSSPQRELEVARTVTGRLLETAPDIVFSYPGQQDGEKCLPSPLLRDGIRTIEAVSAWEGDSWREAQARGAGPRLDPLEGPGPMTGDTARGGSSILKHQALCPFRAFASNRLGAEGLEAPVDGISAKLHGTLVHRVLERFWRETGNQDALLQLEEQQLEARIREHVIDVLNDERGLRFRPQFRRVEAARLQRLLRRCLELDAQREAFRVEGFEREVFCEIDGQAIRLYIDRIDRLANGGLVIIDYKTGRVDPKTWFGERPEDPQLPLYAVSSDETPHGVVFAVMRDDECLFRGVVRGEGIFPGLPPKRRKDNLYLHDAGENMENTVEEWRRVLQRLMADFLAGHAAVDPKNGTRTCEDSWCELRPLCRIRELEGIDTVDSP
ncbi:MAG: PD-(D/E)XK nuclease family protein [Lysobacterales bacterium]|jgi:probable DNA repair protein